MENLERLEKVTFLKLFPQDFEYRHVDDIIDEIESKMREETLPKEERKVNHCEVQTDEIPDENILEDKEEKLIPEIYSYPSQINLIIPLCSSTSFQYNNEAEYASLTGRISNRFRNQELHGVNHQLHILNHPLPTASSRNVMEEFTNPKPLDESLETQQMRRLGEFVEWRRSLLQDGFT